MNDELKKMQAGEWFNSEVPEMCKMREETQKLLWKFNETCDTKYLEKILGEKLDGAFIRAPFYCDYGYNIKLGKNVYFNYNCVVLDVATVTIGENTLIGPNVQMYSVTHPLEVKKRLTCVEKGIPITIGKNCWIGGSAVILPGVTIGDNCVIGAGSVVTKDIPSNTMAVGNPCKVVKTFE